MDPPSASILRMYSIIYGGIAETLRAHGDTALGMKADSIARRVDSEVRRGMRLRGSQPTPDELPPEER
jgi:hypothetical protein